MTDQKTIFHRLDKIDITYSVGVAIQTFDSLDADINNTDYYIMAHKRDEGKIRSLKIITNNCDDKKDFPIIERTLDFYDIQEFKRRLFRKEFVLYSESSDGRIYELKGKSFNKYYNKIKSGENLVDKSK